MYLCAADRTNGSGPEYKCPKNMTINKPLFIGLTRLSSKVNIHYQFLGQTTYLTR